MVQCAYIIEKTGKRCKRQAESGSKYCWQHNPSKENIGKDLYFSLLPLDLFSPLFSYFSNEELLDIFPELQEIHDFNRLISYGRLWKDLWHHNISSIIISPVNTYEE